ncbi:hypothetical protein BK640_29360 [Pseudomonas protegens]|uniref:hypothetical protein n=1 Tax=Pseudomonas chlororaphis TaxID=587753 RepID=UPI000F4640B0|nr:hypothetical protein [Pseudomonas chlororaphis]MCO7585098.1 hypothetical protein [Pseudomonas chlororaphis]MCO7602257.1 hypothetical protein [Pseudomonas chlororaphis]ROL95193.1 hypothetical protein BK640_29360 [Pseudomonas protegens]ROM07601.1 hypothetical protein BK642_13635 [Pseudomonas protegens]
MKASRVVSSCSINIQIKNLLGGCSFQGGLLMLGVAIAVLVSTDWIGFLLTVVVSSIFFIPAFILSEKAFERFVKSMDKISFLAPVIRFFSG